MGTVWNLVMRNRSYRLLLTASLISLSGDWIFSIGMMFYVYRLTGSTLAAGAIVFTAMLPHFLLGSVAGVFADRWDRRTTMVGANVLLACSMLPMMFAHDLGRIWIVYLTVAAQNSIAQFFMAAEAAVVPAVVPADELVVANALNGQNNQIARLVGSALGGMIAVSGGITAVTAANLASYAAAAALIALIPAGMGRSAGEELPRPAGGMRQAFGEWADGVRLCGRDPDLSALLVYRVLSRVGEGVLSALFAPFVIGVIKASGAQFGAVNAIQAIGGIAGGVAITALAARARPAELLGRGALLLGVLTLLLATYPLALPGVAPAFVLVAIVGLPIAAVNAGFYTLLQLRSPEAFRGRVFGAISAAAALAMIAGTILGSTLGTVVGVIPIIAIHGALHIVAGPMVLARLRRAVPARAAAVAVAAGERRP
jgi:Na+/melibiose symporter-like transporter